MSFASQFLQRVRMSAVRRPGTVKTTFLGREREFLAFDQGVDTFIFERGISRRLGERPSVLIVDKRALGRRSPGRVLTMTSGNHAVAALPLLDGRLWHLGKLPQERRSAVLAHDILCANVVDGVLELSQRDVPTETLVRHDEWLCGAMGFTLAGVVMVERNEATLEHYRRQGEEWRVKPLAWTQAEMQVALAASRKRISSQLEYYHSVRGVHLLSFAEFVRFVALAEGNWPEFVKGLKELVSVYAGNDYSFVRMPKHRGHHEIEFFGLQRGVALERLIPELEQLMEAIALGRVGQLGAIQKSREIVRLYESRLTRPELADDESSVFVETIYMYVTGEIYAVVGEGSTQAFDDRRTALPGATFRNGRPELHPGADARTEIMLSNLRGIMSKDERIEYANVYELRGDDANVRLGAGATREVVYKTDRRPLENSLIEKRLSHSTRGYSGYTLARIGALRSLGIGLSQRYLLLKRRAGKGGGREDYYFRNRCEGEPMNAIPANYFRSGEDGTTEAKECVLAAAMMMGDAAAQNLAMKKYDPATETPLYGIGKEIFEFEYDLRLERVVPTKVSTCSVRGSFGWPVLDYTDENLAGIADFYLGHYARVLKAFQCQHAAVAMDEIAAKFMDGFEHRIHALAWQLSVMRDQFESFAPDVPSRFGFAKRWHFAMWSLERHERRLPLLHKKFLEKVDVDYYAPAMKRGGQ